MKILALSELTRSAGGLFYAVRELCRGIRVTGMEISVAGRAAEHLDEDLQTWLPVSAEAFPGYGPIGSSPALRKALMSQDLDIIHVHGIWMDEQWVALQWQTKNGSSVVISPHGMLDPWAVKNSAWKKKLVGKLFANESLRKANCIHALCQSEAESIRAYGLKTPIAVIPNGIDLPEVRSQTSKVSGQQDSLISDLRIPTSGRKRKLLFLGRIHPKKGLNELIEAWAIIQKSEVGGQRTDWELIIAGWDDGGHLDGLKKQASELWIWSEDRKQMSANCSNNDEQNMNNSIHFVGAKFGEEKDSILREVDAFILPSFSEGLPMSVLEAWAYQLPVIMTDFCNIPEGFEAEAAIRIQPDPESIAAGLNRLFAMSDERLSEMGSNGRTLVEEKFTWDNIAKQMKSVYEWCVNGGEPPNCMRFYDR